MFNRLPCHSTGLRLLYRSPPLADRLLNRPVPDGSGLVKND